MGNTYILEGDIRSANYTRIIDESFETTHTFTSGNNTYNGKAYNYVNSSNATHIRAGHGGTPGLEIQCNANASEYSATARTAPGLVNDIKTLISNFDLMRQQVFIIAEVANNPDVDGRGVGFAYDIDYWNSDAKDRMRIGSFHSGGQVQVQYEAIINGTANQPLVSVTSTDKVFMLVVGQGQYAAFYRSAYNGNPIDSGWTILASDSLSVPTSRSLRWNRGHALLYAQGANFAGIIKRYTFGYINIF